MAVIHHETMPEGVPLQMLDEVTDAMGVDADPPDGLIAHVHYERDGRAHVVDIWTSDHAYQMFNKERLGPTVEKVAAAHGMDPSTGPAPDGTVDEIHRLVLGRAGDSHA